MQRLLITVFCLFLAACGGGGGGGGDTTSTSSTTPITPTTPTTPTAPTVTASVADYAGRYSGTIDYNLAQIPKKSGVPMQADVTVDGKLTNVIIDGTTTDATASTMLAASETNNNGVIQGSASYSVQNVPGTVYVNYTGRIDVVSGAVSITYNMSGGLTGTIIVTGKRVIPVANAGTDKVVATNEKQILDSSKSTPVSSVITKSWSIKIKPLNSNAIISNDSFIPDVEGVYTLTLQLNNGKSTSTDDVNYTVYTRPVAKLGTNIITKVGQPVNIDGSASYDVNGRELSYQWTLISDSYWSQFCKLTNTSSKVATFIDNIGTIYIIQLVVNNGYLSSEPATIKMCSNANCGEIPPSVLNNL